MNEEKKALNVYLKKIIKNIEDVTEIDLKDKKQYVIWGLITKKLKTSLEMIKSIHSLAKERYNELDPYDINELEDIDKMGKIDIDRISTSMTDSLRGKITVIKELINKLEQTFGKTIPIEELIRSAKGRGLSEDDTKEAIEKLKRMGNLFEPKKGFLSKI